MPFVVIILIMLTVYVAQNKKLKDSTKTAWFVTLIFIGFLTLLFSIL